MKLTWQKYHDKIFGVSYLLEGIPEGCSGQVRRSGGGNYVAHAFIGDCYLNHKAGTLHAARRALEREIDKRSIGLLGVDILEFEIAAC